MLSLSMIQINDTRILASFLYVRGLVPEDMPFEQIHEKARLVSSSFQYLLVLLEHSSEDEPEETLQSVFFEAGKLHFVKELRWWFELLYNVLMNQKEGPRLGLIARLQGIQWIVDGINNVLNDPWRKT